jgi:acyl-CoA synthetase (AMP-forming)/AMP-acid ligase II
MHPGTHAADAPDKPAVVFAPTGEAISYLELDQRSMQLAQLLASRGVTRGDHVAILMDNTPRYYEVCWASQRSGLYFTPVNWHLTPEEAAYIVEDCGAKVLVASAAVAELAREVAERVPALEVRLMIGGAVDGFEDHDAAVAGQPAEPLPEETEGMVMFYSSGTTGRPKGIERELSGVPFGSGGMLEALMTAVYGFDTDSIYLCPAPLYHAAPLGWSMSTQRIGGTVILMERFDPVEALALIEQHRVSHAQFVPTMFVRMLKLPEEDRRRFDVSSLRTVIHAAAPCPVEVKQQMIDWWGPIVYEYYAGSEGNGFCAIDSKEWLAHPGSVGKALSGTIRIVGDDGEVVPTGDVGVVYFEGTAAFRYHNAPEKTAEAFNDKGWSTLGDVGYVDDEGFLYLTDRKSHMIISGGVNIYPQEVENVLVLHPAVADVAVIGVPHPEMGEEVKAVVQPADPAAAGPDLERELIAYCRDQLAHFKCPRSVDFDAELPRLPTGKLAKRLLRDRYCA